MRSLLVSLLALLVASAQECDPTVQRLGGLAGLVDRPQLLDVVLDALQKAEANLPSSDEVHLATNLCEGIRKLDFVDPFICFLGLPVLAIVYDSRFSVQWILDHSSPCCLLGIVSVVDMDDNVLPHNIGDFRALSVLYLTSVDANLPSSLGQLEILEFLYFKRVVGGAAQLPPFDTMPLLRGITMEIVEGSLVGNWPTFESLTNLATVMLDHVAIADQAPPARMFDLPQLTTLSVTTSLRGLALPPTLPPAIQNLQLEAVHATGTIPTSYGNVPALVRLELAMNDLEGTIPTQLGQLAELNALRLVSVRLHGRIPSQLGRLAKLEMLYLTNNRLSGSIPIQLGRLYSLELLDLGRNQLTGTLPNELAELKRLTSLRLYDNELTGSVSFVSRELQALVEVFIANNSFEGSVPRTKKELWGAHCEFSGLDICAKQFKCDEARGDFLFDSESCVPFEWCLLFPLGTVFGLVLLWFISAYKQARSRASCRKAAWCIINAVAATVDFANAWTMLLAAFGTTQGNRVLCVIFALVSRLCGTLACYLFPEPSDLRRRDFLIVTLSPLLLVEVPWRAVIGRHYKKHPQKADSDNGHGATPREGEEEAKGGAQGEGEGEGEGEQTPSLAVRLRCFVLRAATFVLVMNLGGLCLEVLPLRDSSHHLMATVALGLGLANVTMSALVLAWHGWCTPANAK